jgi:hypothetical protein
VPNREIFIFLLFFVPFVNILLFKIFLLVTAPTHGRKELVFDRNPWWKRLLAMDSLPLSLWPLILEKADTWKCDASWSQPPGRSTLLLKEKNAAKGAAPTKFESENDTSFRHETITIVESKIPKLQVLLFESSDIDANDS